MSVTSVGSTLSSPVVAALLGNSGSSAGGSSATSSASAGDAVTVDLSAIAKSAASGDSSSQAAAVKQLKADLASEQTALLSSLVNPDSSSTADLGNQLLSTIYGSSASQNTGTAGTTIDTTA